MGEVNIKIGGRSFKLGCDDGEERHLLLLAEHLAKHVENLRVAIGQTGDEQLYLMAGLMVCDELWDSRNALANLEAKRTAPTSAQKPEPTSAARVVPIAEIIPPDRTSSGKTSPHITSKERPARTPTARPAAGPLPAAPPKPVAKQT